MCKAAHCTHPSWKVPVCARCTMCLVCCGVLCCAAGGGDVYRLPEHMREAVEEQYKRDVARVHGPEAGRFDDEYKSFIQVWGGGHREQVGW